MLPETLSLGSFEHVVFFYSTSLFPSLQSLLFTPILQTTKMQSFILLAATLLAGVSQCQESVATGPGPVVTFPWHPIDQCGPGITCGPEHLKQTVTIYDRNVTSTSTKTIETIAVCYHPESMTSHLQKYQRFYRSLFYLHSNR